MLKGTSEMGTFDPAVFMQQSFDQAGDTKIVPVPIGEYLALTGEPTMEEVTSQKTGETFLRLTVKCTIMDPAVIALTGRDPTTVRFQTLLDRKEDGNLDFGKGKNIQLNRLREATGNNKPGVAWRIPDLGGKTVKVKVKNRPDPNDSETIYDEVSGFAPA